MYKKVGAKLNIDKNEFFNEIKKSKEQDKLTDKAVDFFIKMAVHGVRHGNLHYQDQRDEEDCIQAALCECLKHWKNFDETQFSDPFSFFSSVIFNGYANQFKIIHRHRFVKTTKLYRCDYNGEFNISRIKSEIMNFYNELTSEVRDRDIKRVQIRLRSDVSSKWQTIKICDLDSIEQFHEEFPFISYFEVKMDFNSSVNFIALDQTSNDSEIFNI